MKFSNRAVTAISSGVVGLLLAASAVHAQTLSGAALVQALRQGGYVIVMRHASSPRETPAKEAANSDNVHSERQLDELGRATAIAMGKALRQLKIPIGDVLSSPTYRALETARLAQLHNAQAYPQLGDNGQSMQAANDAQTAWLKQRVTQFPSGANTVIITHLPNISRAFPQWSSGLADGESLILGPDGKGGATLVARVKIEDWPDMRF